MSIRQKIRKRAATKKLNTWLSARLKKEKLPADKAAIGEYVHVYNRVRQLMPQMIDFVGTIFAERKGGRLNKQLVFLGRGARPFYSIASKLAESEGVKREEIKLIDLGRRLTVKVHESKETRREILAYMKSKGIDITKPITFIDTGVIGTVPNDLIQLFRLEGLGTNVNGYMFYGRDVTTKDVWFYTPSKNVDWKFRKKFSAREVRSLIEELPKFVKTIKELRTIVNGRVGPKYVKSSVGERIGAAAVRMALEDGLEEILRESKGKLNRP